MSMTTVKPQLQAVAEWVKIFPQQVTESYTSSVTFMKQLTVIAVSTITYLKNLFPQDSFTTEYFGGLKLHILKEECDYELAQFISVALKQAFDAFDKKYLHQLALCFYDGDSNEENLVEYHIFEYSYLSDGVAMDVRSKTRDKVENSSSYSFDNVKEKTIQLIRACVVLMETCREELSQSCDISLRLYYNKDAPDGYQAPGFYHPAEEQDHLQSTRRKTIKLGCVETPFHRMTPRTYIKENDFSNEPLSSPNLSSMSLTEEDDFSVFPSQKNVSVSSEKRIQCPCNKIDNDDALLTCLICNTQQHAACFGIRSSDAALLKHHYCIDCCQADPNRQPTDSELVPLSIKRRECLCVVRRALAWCARVPSVSSRDFIRNFALSPLYAVKLMKILHTHQIVHQGPDSDITSVHKVNSNQLKLVTSLFFRRLQFSSSYSNSSQTATEVLSPEPLSKLDTNISHENDANFTGVMKRINPNNYENIVKPKDIVITKVNSLPVDGEDNSINEEDNSMMGSKRKLNTCSRASVRTKRARVLSN